MQPERIPKKPTLPSSSFNKNKDTQEDKKIKAELFYRYRLPSLYRQLRQPIYDNLLSHNDKTLTKPKPIANKAGSKGMSKQQALEMVYKKVMLNSKYHHREKMRFSRTPILKYLKYDFKQLEQKLKSKSYSKIYDDLEDQDEDEDDDKEDKKQYQVDSHFSAEALARYKRKHGINGYIVSAFGYDDIKQRLIEKYGWTQNEDVKSLMYDYKHMSKKKNIDYVNLLDEQVVNHFHQNKSVTAKFGLTRNIRNICSIGKDPAQFFPRCFDVNDVSELQNFYESYKQTFVQSILKRCVANNGAVPEQIQHQIYERLVNVCIKLIQRQFLSIEAKINSVQNEQRLYISDEQWSELRRYEKQLNAKNSVKQQRINQTLFVKAKNLCQIGQKIDPQWKINKDNIWIIKPASLSRGRGIKTFDKIEEMFDYIIGREISWVAQKYIQNPLIVKKRKFDIRQWVLLTDFKPFRVWIYQQCYIRFCATTYQPQNLKDRKIHLTNNSVTKGVSDITNDGISENMLSQRQFAQTLNELQQEKDIFRKIIKPQMEKIAVETLESVRENMIARKSTFQIFGFDFMVDDHYKVWLIEVNSSPTMEYSTKVTTQIVKKGMSDLGDLVNNYMFKGKYYDKSRAKQLYGGWKLLTNP